MDENSEKKEEQTLKLRSPDKFDRCVLRDPFSLQHHFFQWQLQKVANSDEIAKTAKISISES